MERTEFARQLREAFTRILGGNVFTVACPFTNRAFEVGSSDAPLFELDKLEFWATIHDVDLRLFRKWLTWMESGWVCQALTAKGCPCELTSAPVLAPKDFVAGVSDRCARHRPKPIAKLKELLRLARPSPVNEKE